MMDDLNRAIEVTDMAVNSTSDNHPARAGWLNNLCSQLGSRFERTGSMDDINRAVEVTNRAVESTPEDHPDRGAWLNNLGHWLGARFKRTGSMDDLNRAIEVTDMAVESTHEDHPDRADRLKNLGSLLGKRFERIGMMDDLNCAIEVTDMAVNSTSDDHPARARRLNNLGNCLCIRFERTGSMDDLNRAIEVTKMAVNSTPEDNPDRAGMLNSLGNCLGWLFERTGSMDDLNCSIKVTNMAVKSSPEDCSSRATWLNNLGVSLGLRFDRTGSMEDLNHSIKAAEMAVNFRPEDHPDRIGSVNNLGLQLSRRFERTGSIDDINRAIEVTDIAVNSTPEDNPDRAGMLNNLGHQLSMRFDRTGSMDDINRAIEVTDMAVNSTPDDHPNRAGWLNNLGNCLGRRFQQTGSMDDLNCALSAYKDGWNCRSAAPSIRISLAKYAASILASRSNWDESSQLLREAVDLLPAVSPRSLKHTDKQEMLAAFAGLASMAAAAALNAGKTAHHALQLLELGRAIIAGLLIEMRGDISDLKQQHPDLADTFVSLRDELDSPVDRTITLSSTDHTLSWESQASRRRDADQKFSETLAKIRAKTGFHNFLLPPTPDELMAAADPDPIVVVNLSSYRCDAFLVQRTYIRALELPTLTLQEVQERTQERTQDLPSTSLAASSYTTSLLEWLWDSVSRPVLEALGFNNPVSDNNWPRVWWIPTGILSQLPLHAAGYHTRGSTETVLDRVMSSYASSIKSLIFGRRHHIRQPAGPLSDHALLVAMGQTPGLTTSQALPYAEKEIEMLDDLCPSLQLKPIRTAHRKENILKHLQGCRVFHFAGHGQSDPAEPSQSRLLLEDWTTDPLTVDDLRDYKLHENPPFLGYLSACSTGANTANRLADEGIHLVSAFQLAGFRHVVGTLWEVSDKHCVDVARVLYETLRDEGMTDVAVCRGLHRALRELRAGHIDTGQDTRKAFHLNVGTPEKRLLNSHWIPYVHFGV
jgi:tetratricopeptide (TPR) repeat protein